MKAKVVTPNGMEEYLEAQTPEHGDICRRLVTEIRRCLSKAAARLYHGSPAWFIGENAVVGVSVKARAGVTLLFWNGQAFKDQALIPVGQFRAAQASFQGVGEVDMKVLRPLLKKAGEDIWDFASIRKSDSYPDIQRFGWCAGERDTSRERALARLRALRKPLPKGFRFDRDDTNILIYAFASNDPRSARAGSLMAERGYRVAGSQRIHERHAQQAALAVGPD